MDIIQVITRELKVEKWQVEGAVKLIDEGCTIPFISRNFYISCPLPQIPPTGFLGCQRTELLKRNKAYLWPRSKVWMRAL